MYYKLATYVPLWLCRPTLSNDQLIGYSTRTYVRTSRYGYSKDT